MEIKDKVAAARGALERLMMVIPGYYGYKEKEMRREADKLLRMHLAQRFEEERSSLGMLQQKLTDRGQLRVLVALERAMMKLQLLIDRLKTAAYGYAGWFDALKVGEKELEELYLYDQGLLEDVEKLSERIQKVEEATEEVVLVALVEDLLSFLEELNATFTRRQEVILGEGQGKTP